MVRLYAVEEWLRPWAGGEFTLLQPAAGITEIDHLCDSLVKDLTKNRENETTGDARLLVVCADWKPFPSSRRYEQNGVRLLKHLRLTPELGELRRMHALVLSFEPVEELIRRQPGSQILLSRGVTFLRLPEGLEHLKNAEFLDQRARTLADLRGEDLMAAVRADYRPPDSPHEMSNWWGVRQFHAARLEIHPEEAESTPLPSAVEGELRKVSSLEALFLFGYENRRRSSSTQDESSTEFAELQIIENALRDCFAGQKSPTIVLVDDDAHLGWADLLRRSILGPNVNASSNCLQVAPIPRDPEQPPPFDADWVRSNILVHDPDLVLLDLRLLGKKEVELPAGETSGVKVLRELRKQDCGLPVIMMTASNKYWTFRETLREGADGYWMKEGVGEHRPPVSLARHCDELLELILRCVTPRPVPEPPWVNQPIATGGYSDLRRFSRELGCLRGQQAPLWWEKHEWASIKGNDNISEALKQSTADRSKVLTQLESALFLFRDYLRLFENRQGFIAHSDPHAAANEHLRAIVMAGGKVVEYVHGNRAFSERTNEPLTAARIGRDRNNPNAPGRGDLIGQRLHGYRSDSAHADSDPPCRDAVRDYLALLLTYLQVPPPDVTPAPSSGQQGSLAPGQQSPQLLSLVQSYPEFRDAYIRIKGGGKLWIHNQLARKN